MAMQIWRKVLRGTKFVAQMPGVAEIHCWGRCGPTAAQRGVGFIVGETDACVSGSGVPSLSLSCIPPVLVGVEAGGVKKRFTKGAVEGRLDVRTRMSVRRLEDS